jgi:hypothetical protein
MFLRETKIAKSCKTCKMERKDKRSKGFRNKKLERKTMKALHTNDGEKKHGR